MLHHISLQLQLVPRLPLRLSLETLPCNIMMSNWRMNDAQSSIETSAKKGKSLCTSRGRHNPKRITGDVAQCLYWLDYAATGLLLQPTFWGRRHAELHFAHLLGQPCTILRGVNISRSSVYSPETMPLYFLFIRAVEASYLVLRF